MNILGIDTNAKTVKGQKQGYMTAITYLAPARQSGVMNTCPNASDGCKAACLYTSGRGRMSPIQQARVNKTIFFAKNRQAFMTQLIKENNAFIVNKFDLINTWQGSLLYFFILVLTIFILKRYFILNVNIIEIQNIENQIIDK